MSGIEKWLEEIGWSDWELESASSDASFRSYYRLKKGVQSYILMDSSLLLESLAPFLEMNERLSNVKVRVPRIIVKNINLGYLILEDFGSTHYLDILNKENFRELYKKAILEISKMQKADVEGLPLYDKAFLLFEMALMQSWYIEKHLNFTLDNTQQEILKKTLEHIAETVLEQPQGVFVHRDFHSRNIMLTPAHETGVIDFQDARCGAITYDLVSLLKDCYIEWESQEIEALALFYRNHSKLQVSDEIFIKWFDYMGLQRHIKVLGIFSRLHIRDGKEEYLKDLPLTLKYVLETASKYPETSAFAEMLKTVTLTDKGAQ